MRCVVIGAGPSLEKNIDQLKDFGGKIIAADTAWRYAMNHGINPDYVATIEPCGDRTVADHIYPKKDDTVRPVFVHDHWTKFADYHNITKAGNERIFYECPYGMVDVGFYGVYFALNHLKADEIALIGFDRSKDYASYKHVKEIDEWMDKSPHEQLPEYWFPKTSREFSDSIKPGVVFNCTEGGYLNEPNILNIPLRDFKDRPIYKTQLRTPTI